ncbi:MAG: 16S rRNA (cytidine(1402)-2'-O)-methyltransferase [Nitrospinae bacterium]|nr:16S rRNA (cytidine(1402)-2'-O)-methyltransferase [Nitrospinota bacterium]
MKEENSAPGILYLVATPIGNLSDMTPRGVDTLKLADVVAAEDTRHSRILFERFGVSPKKLVSYHAHNVERRTPELERALQDGLSVALISDAGTPGISDPGYALVSAAVRIGARICPIPGASSPVMAVAASGFPSHRFVYEGFLPRKKGRKTIIESWKDEKRTVVFLESPHRIVKTLRDIAGYIGERMVCVAREMTKVHEEFIRGRVSQVADRIEKSGAARGEITVALAPERAGGRWEEQGLEEEGD